MSVSVLQRELAAPPQQLLPMRVQGGVLVLATFYVAINMGIDILYGFLDPRIRRGR